MKHFFGLLKSGLFLIQEEKKQKAYLSNHLKKWLTSLEKDCNGKFSPTLQYKIEKVYALFVPAIMCSSICKLHDKPFTIEERERATALGIISPIYDDFFDNGTLTMEDIERLTNDPQNYECATFEERVFKKLHIWLSQNVIFRELYFKTFEAVRFAQMESLKQTCKEINERELYKITYEKSYHSILLFHSVLSFAVTDDFKKMIYPFAGLLQLGNDVFDVYKDLQEGIYTIPNLNRNIQEFKMRYVSESAAFNKCVMEMHLPTFGKEVFRNVMNAIIARSWLAIKALEKVVNENPQHQNLKLLPRKKLIVDMEKWANKALWLKYIYLFSKLK